MADKRITQLPQGNITLESIFPFVSSNITSQVSFSTIVGALEPYFSGDTQIFVSGMTFNTSNYDLSINRNDGVSFTQNLGILASDMTITGGTYNPSNGIATFINNSGGTFEVTGFITGMTDTYVTGGTYTDGTTTFTNNSGGTFNVTGFSTGSTYFVEVTKSELDILINNDSLIIGTTYKISGVHPTLYDDGNTNGTTIYLQALSENKLTTSGFGEFWNPKYDKEVEGFGVWTNVNNWTPTLLTGFFEPNENIVGDSGQTGQLFGGIESGYFIATSTGWETVTSITGSNSNATASVTSINLKTYNINDKVIWGGYSWTNVGGFVGDKTNILTMNAEWSKDVYSIDNYNKVIDIIEYDYKNDWISRRYEVLGSNDIIQTFDDKSYYGWVYSSISVFMFGNPYDDNYSKGMGGIKVINAYFETVDSYNCKLHNIMVKDAGYISDNRLFSSSMENINLNSESYIQDNTIISADLYSNTLSNYSYIESNILNNGDITYCELSASYIENNYFRNGGMSSNSLKNFSGIGDNIMHNGGTISNNNLNYSNIYNNTMYNNGRIQENEMSNSAEIHNNVFSGNGWSYIERNSINTFSSIRDNVLLQNSNINFNTVSNSSKINQNILDISILISNCELKNNSFFNINSGNPLTTNVILLTMENALISGTLSNETETVLSSNYPKTAYKRPDGVTKLRYYNNFDTLAIIDIV